MIQIFYACVAGCIILAFVNIGIGLFQIVAGLTLNLIAVTLYVLVSFAELVAKLWRTAFYGYL